LHLHQPLQEVVVIPLEVTQAAPTVNGSHQVYMEPGHLARISLPVHGNEDLKIGLLKHFIKIAKITENEF